MVLYSTLYFKSERDLNKSSTNTIHHIFIQHGAHTFSETAFKTETEKEFQAIPLKFQKLFHQKLNITCTRISTQISPNLNYRTSTQIEPQISTQNTQIIIKSIGQAPK